MCRNPDGTERIHPDEREACLLHYLQYFREELKRAQEQVLSQSLQRPATAPRTYTGTRWRAAAPIPEPPSPMRLPDHFARDMSTLRERFQAAPLSPRVRDGLMIESYDCFLNELRRKVCNICNLFVHSDV